MSDRIEEAPGRIGSTGNLWVVIRDYSDFRRFWPTDFPLEIDEHDQLGAKDTKRERSVTEAYCTKTLNTLVFQARLGKIVSCAMVSEYVAIDGRHYNATFGFIWLDLYDGPVGTIDLKYQIHDYNPHISSNGLFWTILVPEDSVEVHLGAGQASFRLTTSRFGAAVFTPFCPKPYLPMTSLLLLALL